jgi:predicted AlkP superfamily phosphohydrolase/phosphomutase
MGAACADERQPPSPADAPRPARTILFAVDGLEWSVALPLVEAGRMPTLAALMEDGRAGRLETSEPTYSPVIWTTIATGRPPVEHGITGFERRMPNGRVLFGSRDRRTKAFWNILSEQPLRVDVVGWWLTYPVERVSGVMVAQTNTAMRVDVAANRGIRKGTLIAGQGGQVHPSDREDEFFEVAHDVERRLPALMREIFGPGAESEDAQIQSLFRASLWALRADAIYAEIGRRLAREDADLLAVYFGGTDVVGHRFWRYREPERFAHPPAAERVRQLGGVIDAYYAYVDHLMGSILTEAGDEVRVLVVSDHGMGAFRTDATYPAEARGKELISGNHLDAPAGVFVAAGPGIQPSGPRTDERAALPAVGSVLDVLPTLLALHGVPKGQDMPGEAMPHVLSAQVLADRPTPLASHDTAAWRQERERLARETPAMLDAERRKQLRELGYIE